MWSALEYGSHCRAVYRVFADRVTLMMEQDDPVFANWDQDATAVDKRYREGDPAVVAGELAQAAEMAAGAAVGAGCALDGCCCARGALVGWL